MPPYAIQTEKRLGNTSQYNNLVRIVNSDGGITRKKYTAQQM